MVAASCHSPEVLKLILENGAAVSRYGLDDQSSLSIAVVQGSNRIVQLPLEKGADLLLESWPNWSLTPLVPEEHTDLKHSWIVVSNQTLYRGDF